MRDEQDATSAFTCAGVYRDSEVKMGALKSHHVHKRTHGNGYIRTCASEPYLFRVAPLRAF